MAGALKANTLSVAWVAPISASDRTVVVSRRRPIPVPGRDDRTDFSRGVPQAYLEEHA